MKEYKYPEEVKYRSYIAIGNFDGVHLGHQKVIKTVVEKAKRSNLFSGVVTFENDPEIYREYSILLTTKQEKKEILKGLKISFIYWLDFIKVKELSPEDFFNEVLVKKLHVKGVVVGEDFKFGKDKKGSINLLKNLGENKNIEVVVLEKVRVKNKIVSSTNIRKMLKKGEVERAEEFLGRPYFMYGKPVKGRGIGKKLGFPTINLKPLEYKLVPQRGIYAGYAYIQNEKLLSAIYVGTAPTFGKREEVIEVYIIGKKIDILPQKLKIEFLKRIRAEKKFTSIQELKQAIKRDVEITQTLLCFQPHSQ